MRVEHVGGCNAGCHGDDHLLIASETPAGGQAVEEFLSKWDPAAFTGIPTKFREDFESAVEAILRDHADANTAAVQRVRAECDAAEDYGIEDQNGDRWVEVAVIRAALDPTEATS